MWLPLIILWAIPAGLVFLIWHRTAHGSLPLKQSERRLLFSRKSRIELTPWVLIQFGLLGSIFFAAGLIEGVVLPNLGTIWSVLAGLISGTAALLTAAVVIRFAPKSRSRSTRFNETREPLFD